MKYLILANNSGGLYRFRKELMEQLIEDGHMVYAVTPFDDSIEELKAIGIRLIELEMNRRGTNLLQEVSLLNNYRKIIGKIHPDMIITYTIKPGIYGGLLARKAKIPYAVNITGLGTAFQKEGILRTVIVKLWRTALKSAKCVFFENEENAKVFLDLKIVDQSKVHVLHGAGVNLEDFPFAEYPASDEQIHFLFIGRVMKEKGIDELFTAMQQLYLQHQNIVLDVVGRCEEDYESKLRELQDEGLIYYYGFQKDVKPFISQAHVFVLPSYHEGMANTLLESAAMGRPLITSNIHGCMEAVQDGKTGFLCEVKNALALIEQMERFLSLSYEDKRLMGEAAHDYVSERFDKQKVVRETIAVLYQVEV